MIRFPCRCRRCGARRTLARHPDDYLRARAYPCGGSYRVDWYRKRKEHKRTNCNCDGLWWSIKNGPHRRGCEGCYNRQR